MYHRIFAYHFYFISQIGCCEINIFVVLFPLLMNQLPRIKKSSKNKYLTSKKGVLR